MVLLAMDSGEEDNMNHPLAGIRNKFNTDHTVLFQTNNNHQHKKQKKKKREKELRDIETHEPES